MLPRNFYLKKILDVKDKDLIKVITGIRRCGKSTLLDLLEEYLLTHGVKPEQIIRMNFESLAFDKINNYVDLNNYILSKRSAPNQKYYILLDEIQKVEDWEKAVNSLRLDRNNDLYITGSNAFLLNSELATLLSGRYIEVRVQPFSFQEYLAFRKNENLDPTQAFNDYLMYGGMPGAVDLLAKKELVKDYLAGICDTVLLKDVIQRNRVRDPLLLEEVLRYTADNVGNMISAKKITDYLASNGKKISFDTIEKYLYMLEQAYIILRVRRFDIKGKVWFKVNDKFYLADVGLRNRLIGFRGADYGHLLENVVYNELLRRGGEIGIGKYKDMEVDFVVTNFGRRKYYQVTATMLDEKVAQRELKVLQEIPDAYEKIILSMDTVRLGDFDGIRVINILDWLLK